MKTTNTEAMTVSEYRHLKAFSKDLSRTLMTLVANTPREMWPAMVETAFVHCAKDAPAAAAQYDSYLPTVSR